MPLENNNNKEKECRCYHTYRSERKAVLGRISVLGGRLEVYPDAG
jgi:hypothetical protein